MYTFNECCYEFSARADTENQVVEVRPRGEESPVFIFSLKELRFLVQLTEGKIDVPAWVEVDEGLV